MHPTGATIPTDPRVLMALRSAHVWVAGGHGFIGSRLSDSLSAHGARVYRFDGDVTDQEAVEASIADVQPHFLYNLAAPVDVARDPSLADLMYRTIVGGAVHILDAASRLEGSPIVIQVGTCEEYGTIPAPFREDALPSAPVSPYSAAKLAATREALRRAKDGAVRAVVARPFLTYGPGQVMPMLVPAAIDAALNGCPFPMTRGLQTRELNYVDDTALGLTRIAAVPELVGQIVNVAGGEERRVVDIAALIFELAGAEPGLLRPGALPTRSGEVSHFYADVTRCREVLGHVPRVSLEEGLRRTIDAARVASVGRAACGESG